jgi:methyl-accepting chemotaxis protein
MKLSHQLTIIVSTAILGVILLSGFALQNLHSTMIENRKHELRKVLTLAVQQASYFVDQERQGRMTHEQAQKAAVSMLSTWRDGKNTYLWVRGDDGRLLVHVRTEDIGKLDESRLPDGTKSYDRFIETLRTEPFGYVQSEVKKPETGEIVPKINGVAKLPGWNWLFGFGVYLDDVEAAFWSLAWNLIIVGVIVLGIVAGAASVLAKKIYARLGGDPVYAAQVAQAIADGNLTQPIQGSFARDSLLGSIARMQVSLRGMIENIQQGADRLTHSTTALNQQMAQINRASQSSSDATHSTAAAIQELSVCIDNISKSARDTEINSEQSSRLAGQGESLVNKASDRIHDVSEQVLKSSASIEELQRRSGQIGGIVNVIKEIAEQTNLLALNAAIEAARAGEQGRGFAVVADEVRTLASRTGKATAEITGMIDAVQADTGSVVKIMQEVLPKVNLSVDMSGEAATTLQQINHGAAATLDMIREVAHAANEQTQATESVAENVDKIASMVKQTASAVDGAKNNVNELEQLALDLHKSVSYFRL